MSIYDDNLKALPELEDIKKWLDAGNKNDFYDSIIKQASVRTLSPRQAEAVKTGADKIKNPPKRIEFDELSAKVFVKVLNYLADISPMGSDFYQSIETQIKNKKFLTEKQWESIKKKFYRFRKSLLRKIFTGSTQK